MEDIMENNKLPNNPLPVYIITKTGVGYNDEGIRDVCDFVLEADTSAAGPQGYGIDESTTGILALSGFHLLDPGTLADALRGTPTARVVLATRNDGSYTLGPYGPGARGLSQIIGLLEAEKDEGLTSHRILLRALRPDLEEELYGGE